MKTTKFIYQIALFFLMFSFIYSSMEKEQTTPKLSLNHFKQIITIENGRKKPIDTFARNILKQFSAKSKFKKLSAIQWLTEMLFTPQQAHQRKIFLIENVEVLHSLGIQTKKARDRYSFSQLKKSIEKLQSLAFSISKIKPNKRNIVEHELILTYEKLYLYQKIIASFQFTIPDEDFTVTNPETKRILKLPEERQTFSLLEIVERSETIKMAKQRALDIKPEDLTPPEAEIAALAKTVDRWFKNFRDIPLMIIPEIHASGELWLSPWDSLRRSYKNNHPIRDEIYLVSLINQAFFNGNQQEFNKSIIALNELVQNQINRKPSHKQISLEIFYNSLDPFYKSKFFYGFALIFLLLSFLFYQKWLYRFSIFLLACGFLIHSTGILSRMLVIGRPPATNLYETFVFTGWVIVLLGIILEFFKKKNMGVLTGSLAGLGLLLIAGKYSMDGDTLGMLVAVLDSNFWLSIHVIAVTVGYAGIVISGIIGHVYIIQNIINPDKEDILNSIFQSIYATQAFGLIFMFAGTVLGGIWADQSWGRFWGWDPKENGALLIIIWSTILFHAYLAKMIKKLGFSYGSVIGIMAVALAWFGVNLLGVGLHAYGFTSGIATALFTFLGFELLFILTTLFLQKKKRKT